MASCTDITAIIHNGHDNVIDLILTEANEVIRDLTPVTKVTLDIDGTVYDSVVLGSGVIWWHEQVEYDGSLTDVLRMKLGHQGITKGVYPNCDLVVYDASNLNGIFWSNNLRIRVI